MSPSASSTPWLFNTPSAVRPGEVSHTPDAMEEAYGDEEQLRPTLSSEYVSARARSLSERWRSFARAIVDCSPFTRVLLLNLAVLFLLLFLVLWLLMEVCSNSEGGC